jgi:spoIIIJ-associated protein
MSDSNGDTEPTNEEFDDHDEQDDDEADDQAETTEGGAEGDAGGEEGAKRRRRRRRKKPAEEAEVSGDERANKALTFVRELLDEMEMDCTARLRRPKPDAPNEVVLEVSGRDSGRIIGKKGQVLGALQFLTNRVINRPGEERRYVTVDAEGYRSRRDSSLATMARRLGKQAVAEGKIITFEPMNPRDRRVVHMALAKFEGVVTKSDGEGDERRVQIIPVRRSTPENG